jgi:DNA-binding transcriptional regulator YiaG
MTDDWTREEADALQHLPRDERLKMRLGPPRTRTLMTGMRLKEIREEIGMTQKEMANVLAMTSDHVSRLERGIVPIGPLVANAAEFALWAANYESYVD